MTTPRVAFTAPEITINGVEMSVKMQNAFTRMRVHSELGLTGRATLVFNDMGYELAKDTSLALGSEVEVSIDGTKVFTGTVTGASLEHDGESLPRLVITADDAGFRLGLTQQMKSWVKQKHSDIIATIAQAHGLRAEVKATTTVNDHLLQRTSDLAFLDMLVRRLGRVWWVEGKTLHATDPITSSAPVDTLDGLASLREFSVRASGLHPQEVDVRGWDRKQKKLIASTGTTRTAPATADSDFATNYVADKAGSRLSTSNAKVLTTVANPLDQDEAKTIASAQVSAWGSASVTARGTASPGAPKLKLNSLVKVTNVGPMSGTYAVTSIEHVFDRDGLVTRFVCGSLRPSGLVDTLASPAAVDDGLTVRGITTGLVTNNKDPDNMGRVKVKLAGTDDSIESDWARVMTLGAGNNRGVVFHPEVNDEVVVGFERGDTRRPVVLGGLVNNNDKLASADKILNASSGKVDYRRVTSRLGHIVELADGETPATKHILLQLANGTNKVRLGDDEMTIDMPAGKPFTLKIGNAKIAIDGQGNIQIEGLKITLKASTDIEISGGTSVAAKGTQLDLTATANAKLAGAAVAVEAQAQASLKGAMVMIN